MIDIKFPFNLPLGQLSNGRVFALYVEGYWLERLACVLPKLQNRKWLFCCQALHTEMKVTGTFRRDPKNQGNSHAMAGVAVKESSLHNTLSTLQRYGKNFCSPPSDQSNFQKKNIDIDFWTCKKYGRQILRGIIFWPGNEILWSETGKSEI